MAVSSFGCARLSKEGEVKCNIAELSKHLSEASGDLSATGFPTRWKSLASNTTRLVRVEENHVYFEVVPTEEQKLNGAFAIAELTKMDDKYVGRVCLGGTCFYSKRKFFSVEEQNKKKLCKFEVPIEITVLTSTRIEGSVMEYSWDSLNCEECQFAESGRTSPFVWVPE